jgi:hypothetical protein
MKTKITLAMLLLGGLLAGGGELAAQGNIITRAQVIASGANTAYEAVVRLRPEWRSTGQQGAFAVFLNGARQGDLSALEQIPAELVSRMEFLEGQRLNERLTSQSASDLAAAIFVTTSRVGEDGVGGRGERKLRFTPRAPMLLVGVSPHLASGDDWTSGPASRGFEEQPSESAFPAELNASLVMFLVDPYYLELFYGEDFGEATTNYYRPTTLQHVQLTRRSRQLGGMIGSQVGPMRVGIGAVGVNTTLRSAYGECYCNTMREFDAMQTGVVTQIAYPVSLLGFFKAEARMSGRYVPRSPEVIYPNGPSVEVGGLQVSAGIRVGLGPPM